MYHHSSIHNLVGWNKTHTHPRPMPRVFNWNMDFRTHKSAFYFHFTHEVVLSTKTNLLEEYKEVLLKHEKYCATK